MNYRVLVFTLVAAVMAGCAAPVIRTSKEEVAQFPLIDAHSHYAPGRGPTAEEYLEIMKAAGISRMVVFEAGMTARGLFGRRFPDRFVLSFQGPIGSDALRAKTRWGTDPDLVKELAGEYERALKSGSYRGLGEILTFHGAKVEQVSPDSPLVLRLLELAGRYAVPINIHCSAESWQDMERALRAYPQTVVIWAHGGSYLSPAVIQDFLRDHPNLYFDLSTKHPPATSRRFFRYPILHGEAIDESWRQVFESYPDRFLVGFDFTDQGNPLGTHQAMAKEAGEFFRTMLVQLTPVTARKIAYENAERLYKFR